MGDDNECDQTITDIALFMAASNDIAKTIQNDGSINFERCLHLIKAQQKLTKAMNEHFPGAIGGSQVLNKVKAVIEARGYTPENTLFAQSVCPDEVNHEEGDITNLFAEYLGEVFHMGGLAGIPFTGKTGFGAFSHHVPDGGHCFVLLAPHVGVDTCGCIGSYARLGQHGRLGDTCGATNGAMSFCESDQELPDLMSCEEDYQMAYLIHQIHKRKSIILNAGNRNAVETELVKQTYEVAKNMLDKIVNVNFGGSTSTLVILTGIQINMPRPSEDYFQPLRFYVMNKDNTVTDLFEETFGHEYNHPSPWEVDDRILLNNKPTPKATRRKKSGKWIKNRLTHDTASTAIDSK